MPFMRGCVFHWCLYVFTVHILTYHYSVFKLKFGCDVLSNIQNTRTTNKAGRKQKLKERDDPSLII